MEKFEHQRYNLFVEKAWDEIPPSGLQSSWNKLFDPGSAAVTEEPSVIPEMLEIVEAIPGCSNCDERDIRDWITMDMNDQGYQLLNDEEIVESVGGGKSNM